MSKPESVMAEELECIICRVPRKNHDAMLQVCREANETFRKHGIRSDVFQLNNTDVPIEGITNIAHVVTTNHDEEVWVNTRYYKDRRHMKDVRAKLSNDKSMMSLYKRSRELMPAGPSFIVGDFDRLNT
jgi:uncharacterized protein YbaA (DUF1428 family)